MTVYVDDMLRPANLTGRPAQWSHLMADTHEELMQAALDLGLRPEWIQHEGTHREHFDVTKSVRERAIAAGIAQPIAYPSGTGELLARKRAGLRGVCPWHPDSPESKDRAARCVVWWRETDVVDDQVQPIAVAEIGPAVPESQSQLFHIAHEETRA